MFSTSRRGTPGPSWRSLSVVSTNWAYFYRVVLANDSDGLVTGNAPPVGGRGVLLKGRSGFDRGVVGVVQTAARARVSGVALAVAAADPGAAGHRGADDAVDRLGGVGVVQGGVGDRVDVHV